MLIGDGYRPTRGVGATHAHGHALDHVWANMSMEPEAVLASSSQVLSEILRGKIPNAVHPSDHLPVGAIFRLQDSSEFTFPAVELPTAVDVAISDEWFEVIQFAG